MFLFIFYFAQTAVLPVYIISDLNGTVAQAGLAMTLFMVSSIVVRPFSGLIIEKFGKKKDLLVSELIFVFFHSLIFWQTILVFCWLSVFCMVSGLVFLLRFVYRLPMTSFQKNVKAKAWAILLCQ